MEKTLVLVKPDGVAKGLIGAIINRFEQRGLAIWGIKMLRLSEEQARIHYREHEGRDYFAGLLASITSGPCVAMVVAGENAVKAVRTMMGATNPLDALPGTIRGEYALNMRYNVIHGSDSLDSAVREMAIYFRPDEILEREGAI